MQTMFWLNLIWVALVDASLRTNTPAYSASNAFFGNLKALALRLGIAHRETGSVDGAYTKIEILYLCVANDENDTDAACVAGINIHKIGLFAKDNVFPSPPCSSLGTGWATAVRRIISLYFVSA